jgi:hypothetical protein
VVLASAGAVLGLGGIRVSRAEDDAKLATDMPQQVTVVAIMAIPGSKAIDSKLASIKTQLDRLQPGHGFKLLNAQSKSLVSSDSVAVDLGNGYTAETWLVRPTDENGKVHFRCELSLNRTLQLSATVKVPLNQLFFVERPLLDDGSKLLLGVGAR